ncbi:hypothetical protein BYT27DRAFT_6875410 [Phlegmacium glaucopus]|nr:hypothetical protein BYT27DRAFT_6875410 [Phlegmacium glaucopus]
MQERRGRSSHQPVPFTPPTPEVPAAVVLASRPPSPAKKHRHITLNEYCTHYNISDIDRSRLQKLEFLPGDPIEKLDRVEWHDEGGFQRLSWDRLLAKNREFLRDVHAGTVWSLNQL